MLFANPYGLLALFAIPILLVIHRLQRQARPLMVSTLFLLHQNTRQNLSGRRLENLTPSIPLWLQILAALILAWLLAEPRFTRAQSTQQIAVVLDSSASMQVFKEKLAATLEKRLPELQGNAENLHLVLSDSASAKAPLYTGNSLGDALASLKNWHPNSGTISPNDALRASRSQIGPQGLLIYATDTPVEKLPYAAALLAIGEATDNVGFTGLTFTEKNGQIHWQTLLKNYSPEAQNVHYRIQDVADKNNSKKFTVSLAPNGVQLIEAPMAALSQSNDSADSGQIQVIIETNDLLADNILPIIPPRPKKLLLHASPADHPLVARLLASVPELETTANPNAADLELIISADRNRSLPDAPVIFIPENLSESAETPPAQLTAEESPLTTELNWQSLYAPQTANLVLAENDQTLVWQGETPLILLRQSSSQHPQLLFNFDLAKSNALKLPATAILLLRFCENLRTEKIAPAQLNLETNQAITIAHHSDLPLVLEVDGKKTIVPPRLNSNLRAPSKASFFTISQGDETLLTAATHFADSRESDLQNCASLDLTAAQTAEATLLHTREDHYWRLWTLVLLALMLLIWHLIFRTQDLRQTAQNHPAG